MMIRIIFWITLLAVLVQSTAGTTDQFYKISKDQWEREYAKGDWEYLDRQAIERAIMNSGRTIRLPVHIIKKISDLQRSYNSKLVLQQFLMNTI